LDVIKFGLDECFLDDSLLGIIDGSWLGSAEYLMDGFKYGVAENGLLHGLEECL
jgi:hypothetical protein